VKDPGYKQRMDSFCCLYPGSFTTTAARSAALPCVSPFSLLLLLLHPLRSASLPIQRLQSTGLAALFDFSQPPAFAPIRCAGGRRSEERAGEPFHSQQLEFFAAWRRRHVLVEGARVSLRDMTVGQRSDDEVLPTGRASGDDDLVAGLYQSMWAGRDAVDIDFASLAGLLRLRSCAEQARDVEPYVEAYVHRDRPSQIALESSTPVTPEEREDVLQLLANYENMARAVESLIHRLKLDAEFDSASPRYREQLRDLTELVPVWRQYAATVRVKFMLERRLTQRPDPGARSTGE
jgi:hypothetical protein